MKKINYPLISIIKQIWKSKLLMVMRATLFIAVISIAQVFALNTYSQSTRLSLNLKDVSIKKLLEQIEDQSEFYFIYDATVIDVDQKVSIESKNKLIPDILDKLFAGTDAIYKINNRQIAISTTKANFGNQQSKAITGKVTNSSGEPIPGVTVYVKGTSQGTVADSDGNYSLTNIADDAVLVFSFVGLKTQDVPVVGKSNINVTLVEEAIGLEEVVAIGYGTVKRKDLTGSISTLDGGLISQRNSIQVGDALQGAIPGVVVTRGAGSAPGSSATIRIRGITTLSNNNPLIIVDGVPVGGIDDVSANDIESMSVLKDAASASIYGARAAAGVILITTKRARKGQAAFEYSTQYGFEKPTELPKYAGPVRYMEMANEITWNDNNNNAGGENPTFPQDHINSYLANNKTNPDQYPVTDWADLILKDHSTRETHELSFMMGSDKIRTKGSFKYEKSDALWNNKEFRRYTARINNDLIINDYLSVQVDVSLRRTINERPNINPIAATHSAGPIYAAIWSDERIASGKQGDNAWGMVEYGGFNNNWVNNMTGKIGIDFKPLDGLKISAIVSPNFTTSKTKTFRKSIPTYSAEDPTVFDTYLADFDITSLSEGRNDNYSITGQLLANYIKMVGDHSINLLAGYEEFYYYSENMGGSRLDYALTNFPYLDLGPLEGINNWGSALENAYRSYFGRIMYDYKNKYLLQANLRYDASSRFASEYRWGSFPSFSAGWVISEESFMEDASWLSFLKLRGSWGRLGNERIGNYPYQSTITFNKAFFYMGSNVTSATTAAQLEYAIRNISWETTETIGVGFDASFLDNRLSVTGDYYQKTTKDMLLDLEIPDFIGYDNPSQNTGIMETKGWEFQVGWRNKIGEIGYSVSANLSDYKSIMGDLGGTQFLGDRIKTEGSEFDEWYGYLSEGLYQAQDEIDNSATLFSSVKPGDIKYIDISGPDGVPDGLISPEYDRTLLGGSLPRFVYGGNIRLDYKNFDFSLVFQGVGKQLAHLSPNMIRPLYRTAQNVPVLVDGNYWSVYNTAEKNQNALYPRLSEKSADSNNYVLSDYWLFNGAYFRLKNITLSYNLPKNLVEKVKLEGVRVYGSISDLLSIDKYPKGWDPEAAVTVYPVTSSFIFGVSVKF